MEKNPDRKDFIKNKTIARLKVIAIDCSQANYYIGQMYLDNAQVDFAYAYFSKVKPSDSHYARAMFECGNILFTNYDNQKAKICFEKARNAAAKNEDHTFVEDCETILYAIELSLKENEPVSNSTSANTTTVSDKLSFFLRYNKKGESQRWPGNNNSQKNHSILVDEGQSTITNRAIKLMQ